MPEVAGVSCGNSADGMLGFGRRGNFGGGPALTLAEVGQQARDLLTALLAVARFVEAAVAALGHGLVFLTVAVDQGRYLPGLFFLLLDHGAVRLMVGEFPGIHGVTAEAGLERELLAHEGERIQGYGVCFHHDQRDHREDRAGHPSGRRGRPEAQGGTHPLVGATEVGTAFRVRGAG